MVGGRPRPNPLAETLVRTFTHRSATNVATTLGIALSVSTMERAAATNGAVAEAEIRAPMSTSRGDSPERSTVNLPRRGGR